jgi:nucleoside-diphosphate kinase
MALKEPGMELQFVVEWFDPQPQLKKQFLLKYSVEENMVEMFDIKHRRLFLRKSPCPPHLHVSDFFIGSKVLLYSRELEVVDANDQITKDYLNQFSTDLFFLFPAFVAQTSNWGDVCQVLFPHTRIAAMKSVALSREEASAVSEISSIPPAHLQDTPVLLGHLILSSETASVEELASRTQALSPDVFLTPLCPPILEHLLQPAKRTCETLDACTCCLVLPHMLVDNLNTGTLLSEILGQGYDISAIKLVQFGQASAEEFLEVYQGVIPFFREKVTSLVQGPTLALEIRAQDAVSTFRRFTAGPWEVGMAKELAPRSIRGRYGLDNVLSAIHCTDLEEDGVAECEYAFRFLD